jgi:Na+-transporting methylmalonyl-CoA/oxaloacetate decarboxylase gamma subunit
MDNWTFGITMIVVGMGGTLLTLWILSLLMSVLKSSSHIKKRKRVSRRLKRRDKTC